MIRSFAIVAALAAAALLASIAVDAGRWEHVGARPPSTIVGGVAEKLLGTRDDVELRKGIDAFVVARDTPYGYDNGMTQGRVRAQAVAQLAAIAGAQPTRGAAQLENLLGVLAWGGTHAPLGVLDPAQQAIDAFTQSARLDPSDSAAAFNLELALRAVAPHGVRTQPGHAGSTHGIGRSGAGAGEPGEGY